jgi:hypothetical protein
MGTPLRKLVFRSADMRGSGCPVVGWGEVASIKDQILILLVSRWGVVCREVE